MHLNGNPVAEFVVAAPDYIYDGDPLPFWFLTDDTPSETSEGYIANFALVDAILDPGTIALLGGPKAQGIFVTDDELFIRGDVDGSGVLNALPDAVFLLGFGFSGGDAPPCMESADVNGDGTLNALSDSLYLLTYGFSGGDPPPPPHPLCGPDPAPTSSLGCETPPACMP